METKKDPTSERKRRRRGRGEGAIYRRADGVWCSSISLGYGPNGKRRRKTVSGNTKEIVKQKLIELHGQLSSGSMGANSKLSVAEMLRRWLEDDVRLNARASTYDSYQRNVSRHIIPRIGHHPLVSLNAVHVQFLLSDMEKAGASARLRQLIYANVHRAFNRAVKMRLITQNVSAGVTRPKVRRVMPPHYDAIQAQRLLSTARGDRLEALYVLALSSAMRQGELLALTWGDVRIDDAALNVCRSLSEVNGRLIINEPKTRAGRRRIELPECAVIALRDHRKRMLAEGHYGADRPVFCNTDGGFIRKQNLVRRSFQPLIRRAGLPIIKFHGLRHSSASLLLSAGVNPKIVQERLGHSTIGVTMDVYSHVQPSLQLEAAAKINLLLQPPAAGTKAQAS